MYYNTANKFYPMDMRKSSYKKIVNSNENRHKEGVSIDGTDTKTYQSGWGGVPS